MFDGHLLYLGSDPFPEQYIQAQSYKVTPNQRQDLNSTRNALGRLHRNVVENMPSKIELVIGGITNDQWEEVRSFIAAHYINQVERKLIVRFFCPDSNDYKEEEMYMPDPQFDVDRINDLTILYKPITLKFIGY